MFKLMVRRVAALGVLLAATAAGASPITYDVLFTQTVGPTTQQSASFVFDSATQLFSNFFFKFQGSTYNLTAIANGAFPGACGGAPIGSSLGFAIMSGTTGCTYEQNWNFAYQTPTTAEIYFLATNTHVTDAASLLAADGPALGTVFVPLGNVPFVPVGGRFSLVAEPSGAVPEPGSVALLAVGLLAAANVARRRRISRG